MQQKEAPPGTRPAPGTFSALLQDIERLSVEAPAGGGVPPGEGRPPGAGGPREDEHAPAPQPGDRIGRFEVVREIGRGGFGVVLEARDPVLGRQVALKLVRPGKRVDRVGAPGLEEAEAVARLSHPNIVHLNDVGISEAGPYLVFELLKGEPLSARIERGPVAVGEAVHIALEVAKGLAHAHGSAVVHRDLKPSNVFLCEDGQVKVLDFGLALVFGRRRVVEGGTPGWMSPEQIRGNPEDERTDVWALGAILFRMLAGRSPSKATLEVTEAPELVALVKRMMAVDPAARPRDAGEVARALEPLVRDLEARTRPPSVRVRRRWAGWTRLAVGGGALLAAMLLAWWSITVLRAPSGPPRASGPADPLRVGVADVVNETGEKDLDVLSGLLVTSLEQARSLTVMTRDRLLDLAAQSGRHESRVDEGLGRAVCRANAIGTLLLPAVRRLGSVFLVEVRVVDPLRDAHRFTVSERATTKEAILDALDRIADGIFQKLGAGPAPSSRVGLGEGMTRNLEAYQHYLAGIEALHRDNHPPAAVREQLAAIALDPEFAAAHYELALMWEDYGLDGSDSFAIALRHADRMPEKERLVIRGTAAIAQGRPDEGVRLADQLMERFPEDKNAIMNAGRFLRGAGKKDRATAAWAKVIELDPAIFPVLWNHLEGLRGARGRPTDESLAACRKAVAVRRNAMTLLTLGTELMVAGQTQEALPLILESLRVDEGRSSDNAIIATWLLTLLGRGRDALPFLDRIAVSGENWMERRNALGGLAYVLLYEGRLREAVAGQDHDLVRQAARDRFWLGFGGTTTSELGHARTDALLELARARLIGDSWARRNFLAWFGDTPGGVAAAAAVASEQGQTQSSTGWFAEGIFQASRAVGERRFVDAVQDLEALVTRVRTPGRGVTFGTHSGDGRNETATVGWHGLHALLAEALIGAGKLEAAARLRDDVPEAFEWHSWEIEPQLLDQLVNHPRVVIARAEALERLGRRPEARKDLEALLGIWREADHDLPLYVLARSRLLEPMDSATSRDGPLDPFPRVGPEQRLRVARADATAQATPESLAWLAAAEQVAGAGKRALGTAREALRLDDGTRIRSVDLACGVLEQQGAPAECVPHLERVVARGRDGYERHAAKRKLAHLLALLGRVREAVALGRDDSYFEEPALSAAGRWPREAADIAAYHRKRTEMGDAVTLGIAQELAWYGDLDGAARAYHRWKEADGPGDDRWYRAIVAAHERRYDEAIRLYRELVASDDEVGIGTDRHCGLAETLLAAGRAEEVVGVRVPWGAWLENERHAGSAYPCLTVVRARALERLDRRAEAAAELDGLLTLWKQADPDLPLLAEARALRSELGPPTTVRAP